MDLVQGVADLSDATFEGRRATIAVLVTPQAHTFLGILRITRAFRRQLEADNAEESVVGTEHVPQDLAEGPLTFSRQPVEILIEYACEGARQIAICMVVLPEDALGLRRCGGPQSGKPDGEVAKLVLRHQEGEPKALVVVLAPDPGAAHLRVGQIDSRLDERLDGFGDRRHQSATAGTPATVSDATRSTTLWR